MERNAVRLLREVLAQIESGPDAQEKLRAYVKNSGVPREDRMRGGFAWLDLEGGWYNVDGHADLVPFEEGEDVGVEEMNDAGFVRVGWQKGRGTWFLYVEHRGMTPSQREAVALEAERRKAKIVWDDSRQQRAQLVSPSFVRLFHTSEDESVNEAASGADDAKYLAAVKRGDMKACQRMVDAAAKKAGYNIGPVWHGTDWKRFKDNRFDPRRIAQFLTIGRGFFFTDSKEAAAGHGDPRAFYLSIHNPFSWKRVMTRLPRGHHSPEEMVRDDVWDIYGEEVWDAISSGDRGSSRILDANGIDGVIGPGEWNAENWKGTKEPPGFWTWQFLQYVVWHPEQIKSADPVVYDDQGKVIPLSRRFNPGSADIREARSSSKRVHTGVILGATQIERDGESVVGVGQTKSRWFPDLGYDDYHAGHISHPWIWSETGDVDEATPEMDAFVPYDAWVYDVGTKRLFMWTLGNEGRVCRHAASAAGEHLLRKYGISGDMQTRAIGEGVDGTIVPTREEIRGRSTRLPFFYHVGPLGEYDRESSKWGHGGIFGVSRIKDAAALFRPGVRGIAIRGPFRIYEIDDVENGSYDIMRGITTDAQWLSYATRVAKALSMGDPPWIPPKGSFGVTVFRDFHRALRDGLEAAGFDGWWMGGEIVIWNSEKLNDRSRRSAFLAKESVEPHQKGVRESALDAALDDAVEKVEKHQRDTRYRTRPERSRRRNDKRRRRW